MLKVYEELVKLISGGGRGVLATIVESHGSTPRKAGAKMLIRENGSLVGTVGGGGLEHEIMKHVKEVLDSGKTKVIHFDLSGKDGAVQMICGGEADVFLEPILGPDTLYVFGAGHISQVVARIGEMLGFRLVIVDPRPEYNSRERFPAAASLIPEEYDSAFSKLDVTSNDYIIIYTSGHVSDSKCLQFAVGTPARYIGMIGSRKKAKEVKERLEAQGVPRAELDRVRSPMGVEIGAETPEEIAISILAEIIRVKRTGSAD